MELEDLPALLSSRICHDLVSPVGAIQNGLDLLAEIAPPGLEDELALIRQSSGRAADILKLYRIAFGMAQTGASVQVSSLREQALAVVGSGKTEWTWPDPGPAVMGRAAARLAAVMILCARTATQLGGTVQVSAGGDGAFRVAVGSGRLSLSEVQAAVLDGREPPEPPGPRDIEFVLVGAWAEAAGYRLQTSRGPNALCLDARPATAAAHPAAAP